MTVFTSCMSLGSSDFCGQNLSSWYMYIGRVDRGRGYGDKGTGAGVEGRGAGVEEAGSFYKSLKGVRHVSSRVRIMAP